MPDRPRGRARREASSRPPRIAIVAASPGIVGGQSVQAASLLAGLRRDGTDAVLLPVDPPFPAPLRWVRRIPYLRTLVNQAFYLPGLARLAGADVVHVFSASYWSFLVSPVPAMLAGRLFGKRVLLHYHSGEAADHLANWGWLVHPWLRLAHEIVVPSVYLQKVFADHGHVARVIPNIVDLTRFRFRARRPLRPHLLSVRNFEPWYRVEIVLDAFARVRREIPDATLTIAGCGSQEGLLRRRAAALGGEAVRFVGTVAQADMPRLYDAADIFVNASIVDNQPVSVLEAFAAGLPVVSTPTGDIGALVRDGETGCLVRPEDPEGMAAAVLGLLAQPGRALEMAGRARQELDRFTWPAVGRQWAALYGVPS